MGSAASDGSTSAPSNAGAEAQPANGDGPETSAGAVTAVASTEVPSARTADLRQVSIGTSCDAGALLTVGSAAARRDAVPLAERGLPTGTVTFLFSDVEGSTRLLDELGAERYAEALADHRRVFRDAFEANGGVEVDTQGDSFFVAFREAPAALAAAARVQAELASGPIAVRIGIHTGTGLVADGGYVGADVHRAARIAAAAHGGQTVVSSSTAALARGAGLVSLGEHRFKDLAASERVFQLGHGEFPPLNSLGRTNLPVPATPFLGRGSELAAVTGLAGRADVRIVTLTGPGGTGKTRLAVQAAAELADSHPDGTRWVPLAAVRDPALVLSAVADALDVRGDPGGSFEQAVLAALDGRRELLLLDNVEHLLPHAATLIGQLVSVPGPTVLVTSRERLRLQAEHVYAVPALSEPDAEKLFVARARQLDAGFRATPAVAELCRRLDDLPLALELAAARTPLFSTEQLLERLGDRLDLLQGGRDADPRQQTLRATVEWSHDLLDEAEQRLFARLTVFATGCTFEAAEAVCEADPETLQALVDKSFLRRRETAAGPRFWMLGTIRDYGAERLAASEEEEEFASATPIGACRSSRRLRTTPSVPGSSAHVRSLPKSAARSQRRWHGPARRAGTSSRSGSARRLAGSGLCCSCPRRAPGWSTPSASSPARRASCARRRCMRAGRSRSSCSPTRPAR